MLRLRLLSAFARTAPNSLLEALVFGRRAAQDIMGRTAAFGRCPAVPSKELDVSGAPLPHGLADRIHEIMQQSYFVLPDYDAAPDGASIRPPPSESGFSPAALPLRRPTASG